MIFYSTKGLLFFFARKIKWGEVAIETERFRMGCSFCRVLIVPPPPPGYNPPELTSKSPVCSFGFLPW